ncbi:MAG: recombination regulator RecX [Candidatus Methylopumilus sp.]|jgi:regulatory protein|nr:recombination regulator RecX [Candidatus Methylopumilus sp.]
MTQQINDKKKPQVSLRQRALDYLAKREYSVAELAQKLNKVARQYELDADEIPAILADFKKRNWVSDTRFTEQILHARKSKFGSARIANELREKGVSDELISEAVQDVKENELANAKAVWRKKYDMPPASREEWAKQARFLQSRGFGFEIIKKVINEQEDEV